MDEFKHLTDILKEWKRQRKSLADYVEDEGHHEAVLRDLYKLRDLADSELREEQGKRTEAQVKKFIGRREYFLKITVPYEEGRLLGWQAPIVEKNRFDFVNLKGFCFLTRQDGAVTTISFELEETEIEAIFWKNGATQETETFFKRGVAVNRSVPSSINFDPPKTSGELLIVKHTPDAIERVPLS